MDKAWPPRLIRCSGTFNQPATNVVWCGDILNTDLHTGDGLLYLATVIDLYSRRVISWAAPGYVRTELVADAVEMAVATRGGQVPGVVFHSDCGSVDTSRTFGQLCERH